MKTKQKLLRAAVLLAMLTLSARPAASAPGDLDTTFGGTGKVMTAIGSINDYGSSVAVQGDGKIVVAGGSSNGSNNDFAAARYNDDGTLDTTFGTGGKVTTGFSNGAFPAVSYEDFANSVAIQSDGKILAAGYSYDGINTDFAVTRYNADGTLDTSFNPSIFTLFQGRVKTAIGSGDDYGKSVAVQGDGKIVVAGYSYNGSNEDFAVVRYNDDGSLDTTFGGTGKVTTAIGSSMDFGAGVAVQDDGKIVVAGSSWGGSNNDFAVVRYYPNGILDTTFGGTGKVTTAIGSGNDRGTGVVLQDDGKIVVAGESSNGINNDFAVVRYNDNGTLDTTFNGTGRVTTAIGSSNDTGYSVALQEDGKIVVAGESSSGSGYDFAMARYNANGTLDSAFSGTGKVTITTGSSSSRVNSVTMQGDGKIVLAGYANNGSNDDFAVARFDGLIFQPDSRIGTRPALLKGDNVHNLNAAGQSQGVSLEANQTKTVYVSIQNDGEASDSLIVRGARGNPAFSVKYFKGNTNVTGRILAGTFQTGPVAPNAVFSLKAKVTTKTAIPAKTRKFLIKTTSDRNASKQDVVLIKARSTGP